MTDEEPTAGGAAGGGVPLRDIPPGTAARLAELGAPALTLYRALANQPDLLAAWVEFAWALRRDCRTPRALRELVILRGALLAGSEYEWHQHRRMAREAGVPDGQVADLGRWQDSARFDPRERAALAFTDAVARGAVTEAVDAELTRLFDPAERVELTLTAAFYAMVPRVLDALRVPVEDDPPA